MDETDLSYKTDLRAIRSAIVALTLSVLATALILDGDAFGLALFAVSLLMCLHAFITPIISG